MEQQLADISTTRVIRRADIGLADEDDAQRTASLLVISGSGMGELHPLQAPRTTLGRDPECGLVIDDEGISRVHCAFVREGHDAVRVEDLDSTNGTWVNRAKIRACDLKNGDRIRVGANTILRFLLESPGDQAHYQSLYHAAIRDELTGAFNKRHLMERLAAEVAFARRHGSELTLILFDIDDFKHVNDTFGHAAGDALLSQLGSLLLEHTREEDVVARFGGDEFAILARGTCAQGAWELAERLRRAVQGTVFEEESVEIRATLSIGTATMLGTRPMTVEELFKTADRALYVAKETGKNRVASL